MNSNEDDISGYDHPEEKPDGYETPIERATRIVSHLYKYHIHFEDCNPVDCKDESHWFDPYGGIDDSDHPHVPLSHL
jgi:hypothetical protein